MFFYTEELKFKYGFADGDKLSELDLHGVDHQDVLIEVLKTKVIPKIEQKVEFDVYDTCHNPVRLKDEYFDLDLQPESVAVSIDTIKQIAKRMNEK